MAGSSGTKKNSLPDTSIHSFYYISLPEAEKIVEQPAYLKDSIWDIEGGIWKFKCFYFASNPDSISKLVAKLYYGFENYNHVSDAKTFIDYIRKQNSQSTPVTNLEQTGDEAFLAFGPQKNPIIFIRKDKRIYKLGLTWLTTSSSLDELLKIAKKIVTSP